MLIINADDFGRSRLATDRILSCFKQDRVTSTSAMVFMEDSQRAAALAKEYNLDVGLHFNFTQELTQPAPESLLFDYHTRVRKYLTANGYNFLIYNPAIFKQVEYVYKAQIEEFERLYGASPSHIDGHHHMHLCANLLIGNLIPKGRKVRRNFTFARGEKSFPNRMYRAAIDKWLSKRYIITDYLFSLPELIKSGRLAQALDLAKNSCVEFEAHPELNGDFEWLMGDTYSQATSTLKKGTYRQLDEFRVLEKDTEIYHL